MKTKHLLSATVIGFAIFQASHANAQTPSFQWAKRIASTANDDFEPGNGLAIDNAANLYMTGWFDGTNDFGGVALTNLSGGGQDIFVAKYNSTGALQWVRRAGGSSANRDGGRGVGVDNIGSIYVTGEFYGAANFDGVILSGAADQEQFFLAKYQTDGTVEWVHQSEGAWGVYGTGLAVDGEGNSYAVGFADNGATITFGTTTLTSDYFTGYGTFLVKYDKAGDIQWAKLFDSPDACYSTVVTLDGSGNVYASGSFRTSVSIGATNFTSTGSKDGFVAKFNNSGDLQWARQMSGPSDSSGLATAAVDASGSVYVVGGFGYAAGDTIAFGPSITLTNIGGGILGTGIGDAFLAKYDGSNGMAQWARRAEGTNFDGYTGVSTDAQGNIYVGGGTGGTGVLDGFGAVVVKYDTNGVVQWAQSSTGTNGAIVYGGPVLDAAGSCYVAGWFRTNAVFGTNTLTGRGSWDFFLAKVGYAPLTLGIAWSNSLPRLSVSGDIGTRFALEYVPALTTGNSWVSWVTNTLTSNPFLLTDTNSTGNSNRFYRARLVP